MNVQRVESLLAELNEILDNEGRPNPVELAAMRRRELDALEEIETCRLVSKIDNELKCSCANGYSNVDAWTNLDLRDTELNCRAVAKAVAAKYRAAGFRAFATFESRNRYRVVVKLPLRRKWWNPLTWI